MIITMSAENASGQSEFAGFDYLIASPLGLKA
jgi:hypothetical protein